MLLKTYSRPWPLALLLAAAIMLEGCSHGGASLNVSQFGSLQATHDALPKSGGRLVLPCGNYGKQHLVISKPNVELAGDGACSILDENGDTSQQPAIQVKANGAYLHDLVIDGSPGSQAMESLVSIGIANQSPVESVRVERLALNDAGAVAINVQNARHVYIRANQIYRPHFSGIRLAGRNVGGVSEASVEYNFIQDPNQSQNQGHSGIHADGDPTSNNVRDLVVAHNTVEVTGQHGTVGFQLNNVEGVHLSENRFIGNRMTGEGIAFTGNNISVENNEVSGAAAAGILFFATRTGFQNVTIARNKVYDNAGQGIALVWGENDVTIKDVSIRENRCYDTGAMRQKMAIQTYRDSGVTNGAVSNVRVQNNSVAGDPSTALNLLPPTSGQYDLGR